MHENLFLQEKLNKETNFELKNSGINRSVQVWLLIGVILVFFQIFIGGVTRLTDSGLSITEWEVIQGTLPPMNEQAWNEAFDKYKQAAKKQYESIHAEMSLSEFKVIYFWEYFHRLWARMMGLVFAIPFVIFLVKKQIPRWLLKRLGVVIGLASLAAIFGWIMVASGLNDDTRTWVSAYKLIIHLAIATTLIAYLFWTFLLAFFGKEKLSTTTRSMTSIRKFSWIVLGLLLIQILFGGLMAGMRAGLLHPHFPFFVEADYFYSALGNLKEVEEGKVIDYEPAVFVKAWVQLAHRLLAYALVVLVGWFIWRISKIERINKNLVFGKFTLLGLLVIQFVLGILTVINSVGRIPVFYGVIHQSVAILLLGTLLFIIFHLNFKSQKMI